MFRIVLPGLVCLVLGGPVRGQDRSPAAYDQAQAAFGMLDFEGALRHLETAWRTPGNQPGDLVRIHSLRALCLISLGKEAEAELAWKSVLSIDPDFRLGPDVSPRYAEPFGRILEKGVPVLAVKVTSPPAVGEGDTVTIRVRLESDPAGMSHHLKLHHRSAGTRTYQTSGVDLARGVDRRIDLPDAADDVEWYAQVFDENEGVLMRLGDPDRPHRIRVEPKPAPPVAIAPPAGEVVPPPPEAEEEPAWYERWWVWAIVGGAVTAVAVGTTVGVLASGGDATERDFVLVIE